MAIIGMIKTKKMAKNGIKDSTSRFNNVFIFLMVWKYRVLFRRKGYKKKEIFFNKNIC
jgi:hypothetical protein